MTFGHERPVKATRKVHVCDACRQPIEIGSPAKRWAGVSEETAVFDSCVFHVDCRAAEIAYNSLFDLQWDEWTPLYEIPGLEPEGIEWLRKEYPVVADRVLGKQRRTAKERSDD